jgi:hypothetical protein
MLVPANNGSKKTDKINKIKQIILRFVRFMKSDEYPNQGCSDR